MASAISSLYIFILIKSGEGHRCSNDCPCGELKGTRGEEGWSGREGIGSDHNVVRRVVFKQQSDFPVCAFLTFCSPLHQAWAVWKLYISKLRREQLLCRKTASNTWLFIHLSILVRPLTCRSLENINEEDKKGAEKSENDQNKNHICESLVLVIGDQTGDKLNRDEWQGKGHILMYQAEGWHDPLPAVSNRFHLTSPFFWLLLLSCCLSCRPHRDSNICVAAFWCRKRSPKLDLRSQFNLSAPHLTQSIRLHE